MQVWLPEMLTNLKFSGYLELALSADEWAQVQSAPLVLLAELYPDDYASYSSVMAGTADVPPVVYEGLQSRARVFAAEMRAKRLARRAAQP
jgi:hypothetical protein